MLQIRRRGRALRLFERDDPLGALLEIGELGAKGVAAGDDLCERRTVLLLQAFKERQPVFHLLEPRRRRLDAVGVAAQVFRQVLELRLDAVAGVEIRLERGVERGKLTDPPPHAAE